MVVSLYLIAVFSEFPTLLKTLSGEDLTSEFFRPANLLTFQI